MRNMILLTTNATPAHPVSPHARQVTSIDVATDLDHITAIMELIENSLEALLTAGDPNDTSIAKVDIKMDQLTSSITITDNGCGMSKDDVHRAINMAQRKQQQTAEEIAEDDMLSGRFGRFGVGLKAAFVFGKSVLLRLDSKQAVAGGRVTAELDYRAMQETGVYSGTIAMPKTSVGDATHGTTIKISRIDTAFWKEHGTDQLGTWRLNEAAKKRLAEKYCLYMHGVNDIQRAMETKGYKKGLEMARKGSGQRRPLQICVDGTNLQQELHNNHVLQRIHSLCGVRPRVDLLQSGSGEQLSQELCQVWPNPMWHQTLIAKGEAGGGGAGGTPGRRRKNDRACAELLLFFQPKIGEETKEQVEENAGGSTMPRIMVFWQGLYFAEERLDAQVLPWMAKAKDSLKKRTDAELLDAHERVVGFLFLDGSFRPDSHKTRLHMQVPCARTTKHRIHTHTCACIQHRAPMCRTSRSRS